MKLQFKEWFAEQELLNDGFFSQAAKWASIPLIGLATSL